MKSRKFQVFVRLGILAELLPEIMAPGPRDLTSSVRYVIGFVIMEKESA